MNKLPFDKVGSGKSIVNRHEQTFKRGSLMFIEGESSTEMFIIRSGKIRVLKQEGESTIELAVLGPGSVIGELALLDHQPRSATAQVIEDTVVTVIDEDLFTRTIEKIPAWLANLIQLVVKRLRDTMKRTSDDIVNKNIAGVIKVLLLLYDSNTITVNGEKVISLSRIKQDVFAVIGLGNMEVENVFLHLIFKEMVLIRCSGTAEEFVFVKDPLVLLLYMNYLRAHNRGLTIAGEQFDDETFDLAGYILLAGEKNGRKEKERLVAVGLPQVELELERNRKRHSVNLDALDKLIEARLVFKQGSETSTDYGKHKRVVLVYNEDSLKKINLLKLWLPVFREEIRF